MSHKGKEIYSRKFFFDMAPAKKSKQSSVPLSSTYCWVSFEDYLRPSQFKKQSLIFAHKGNKQKAPLRLKLLEHPVLIAGHKTKYVRLKERIFKYMPRTRLNVSCAQLKLHRFLSFLRARNDKITCKRKSGFEIYCEIASIHGFTNFVGATTLQRTFWFFVVLLAVALSGAVLLALHLRRFETPTILYPENTQYPTSNMLFPAITICNLNRISKVEAESVAKSFENSNNLTINALTNYFKLALYTTESIKADANDYGILNGILKLNNFTMERLLYEIAPSCERHLSKCSFQGIIMRCTNLFQSTQTSIGRCCSFNYNALKKLKNENGAGVVDPRLFYISNSVYDSGLSVLLDPHLDDYKASSLLTPGFQILIHDTHDFADEGTNSQRIITTNTFNNINISPQQTYASDHISSLEINERKCYLPNERKLFRFPAYSQRNCLAECRALKFFERCKCALPYRPKMQNWTVCGLEDAQCYYKYKYLLSTTLKFSTLLRHEEEFICDCYPSCDIIIYSNIMDSGRFSRKYSLTEKGFHRINITDHILLRAFVTVSHMERLRLDVSKNWLSFLGTFGGITGLFMGYSFLSGFELVFFVFVRPACNWWMKRSIKKRIKAAEQT